MKQGKMYVSEFYCTECGRKGIPVVRRPNQQREAGHLKKLYCLYCKKETNHAEIRPFGSYTVEDFQREYELGRFEDGNRVPTKDLLKCSKVDCEYNVDGKCWNSNYTYECKHRIDRS